MNSETEPTQVVRDEQVAEVRPLTEEEREDVLAAIKEARLTQPAYAARMRAFGRHTQETMRRRFNV